MNNLTSSSPETPPRWRRPLYDVRTEEDHFVIRAVMPGVDKEHVTVSLVGKELTIEGTRKDSLPENWRPLVQELNRDNYRLQLQLNVDVADHITARVEQGVLTVELPKAEESKPRLIAVQ